MLWYKCWLETRFLTRFLIVYAIFPIALFAFVRPPANVPQDSLAAVENAVGFFGLYYSMIPVLLAGSGIKAQAGPQGQQGLHASTHFTLSLPVSRLRLIATRAGLGMLETAAILAIVPGAVWIMHPVLRAQTTGSDLFLYWVTLSVCVSAVYSLGTLISTLIGDPLRGFASMFGVLILWWLLSRVPLPPSFDIFEAMGRSSPLFTHTLPWASMGVSLGAAGILFLAAVKVVQKQEY